MRNRKILIVTLALVIIIAATALLYLYFQDQPEITYQGTFVANCKYNKG